MWHIDRAVEVLYSADALECERSEANEALEEALADPYFFVFAVEKSLELPLQAGQLLFFYLKGTPTYVLTRCCGLSWRSCMCAQCNATIHRIGRRPCS